MCLNNVRPHCIAASVLTNGVEIIVLRSVRKLEKRRLDIKQARAFDGVTTSLQSVAPSSPSSGITAVLEEADQGASQTGGSVGKDIQGESHLLRA